MQPICAPIGRLIRSVTPDRAHLHTADALPGLLSAVNALGADQLVAARIGKFYHRRRLPIHLAAVKTQETKAHDEHHYERHPELFKFCHFHSFN